MTHLVLVGAGALGSHLVLAGRSNPDLSWTIIDFDRVESKNTLGQFHPRSGIGRNKAQALSQAMLGLFGRTLKVIPHRLGPDNVEALLGRADLVIDCLDNGASRQVVQDFVRARDLPCLHGAVSRDGDMGRVAWDPVFTIDHETVAGQATCEGGEHLPYLMILGARLALAMEQWYADGTQESWTVLPRMSILLDRRVDERRRNRTQNARGTS